MNTILAIVQAERDGAIESKMVRMRRLEEIRTARVKEGESKKGEVERVVGDIKMKEKEKRKKRRSGGEDEKVKVQGEGKEDRREGGKNLKKRKTVAFA
jgi:60S ribosomal subunit assembly/export protein LOC1